MTRLTSQLEFHKIIAIHERFGRYVTPKTLKVAAEVKPTGKQAISVHVTNTTRSNNKSNNAEVIEDDHRLGKADEKAKKKNKLSVSRT